MAWLMGQAPKTKIVESQGWHFTVYKKTLLSHNTRKLNRENVR